MARDCFNVFFSAYSPHLFRHTVVVNLQCVLLLVIVRRNNHPNHNNNLTYKKRQTEKLIDMMEAEKKESMNQIFQSSNQETITHLSEGNVLSPVLL